MVVIYLRKRTNKTPNQIEFERQLKRINRSIKKLQQQGYVVDQRILGRTDYTRYTKQAISRLKQIKPATIRAASVHESPTGDLISGTEYYKKQRSEQAKKGWETRRAKKKSAQAEVDKTPTFTVKKYLIDTLNNYFSDVADDTNAKKILDNLSSAINSADSKLLYDNENYIASTIAEIRSIYDSDQEEAVKTAEDLSTFISRLKENTSLFDTVSSLGYYDVDDGYSNYNDYE